MRGIYFTENEYGCSLLEQWLVVLDVGSTHSYHSRSLQVLVSLATNVGVRISPAIIMAIHNMALKNACYTPVICMLTQPFELPMEAAALLPENADRPQ